MSRGNEVLADSAALVMRIAGFCWRAGSASAIKGWRRLILAAPLGVLALAIGTYFAWALAGRWSADRWLVPASIAAIWVVTIGFIVWRFAAVMKDWKRDE